MSEIEKPQKAKAEKVVQGVRKLPSGRYQVRYTGPDGKRYSGGIFTDPKDAEKSLRRTLVRTETEVDKGSWKPPRKTSDPGPNPKTLTIRGLSEEWIRSRVDRQGRPLAPKTVELYRRLVDHPLREFADQPIRQIHSETILAWWNRAEFGNARTRNGSILGPYRVPGCPGYLVVGCVDNLLDAQLTLRLIAKLGAPGEHPNPSGGEENREQKGG